VSEPKFGEGPPETRASRRLALGIGGFVIAVILVLAIVAIVG
jgi:hypothetical protein